MGTPTLVSPATVVHGVDDELAPQPVRVTDGALHVVGVSAGGVARPAGPGYSALHITAVDPVPAGSDVTRSDGSPLTAAALSAPTVDEGVLLRIPIREAGYSGIAVYAQTKLAVAGGFVRVGVIRVGVEAFPQNGLSDNLNRMLETASPLGGVDVALHKPPFLNDGLDTASEPGDHPYVLLGTGKWADAPTVGSFEFWIYRW